jgi:GNAT superfamily N-acetyltransferase
VHATPELLRRHLFAPVPRAHALLAVAGTPVAPREPIGLALYFFNFSTWTGRPGIYLEDLYVAPACRAHGVGTEFFATLARIAQEQDCPRLDWSVLKWNQPSIDFYEKRLGATRMSAWVGMRLEGDGIARLALPANTGSGVAGPVDT